MLEENISSGSTPKYQELLLGYLRLLSICIINFSNC